MTTLPAYLVRRTAGRSGARRLLPCLLLPALLSACTNTSATSTSATNTSATSTAATSTSATSTSARIQPNGEPDASDVVRSLGAVPIPVAPAHQPTATAAVGRPALLAMGEPVRVTLPGNAVAVVSALGPDQASSSMSTNAPAATAASRAARARQSTRATITLRASALRGELAVSAAELSSRDETGHAVALTAVGAPRARATAQRTGAVTVVGTFDSGAAQVTWRHDGHVLAIWTFTVELD